MIGDVFCLCMVYVQRNCKVVWDRCNDRERELVGWLWEALRSFSAAERRLFLRFVSGRSRVPQGWTLGHSAGAGTFVTPTRMFELHIMRCILTQRRETANMNHCRQFKFQHLMRFAHSIR